MLTLCGSCKAVSPSKVCESCRTFEGGDGEPSPGPDPWDLVQDPDAYTSAAALRRSHTRRRP